MIRRTRVHTHINRYTHKFNHIDTHARIYTNRDTHKLNHIDTLASIHTCKPQTNIHENVHIRIYMPILLFSYFASINI